MPAKRLYLELLVIGIVFFCVYAGKARFSHIDLLLFPTSPKQAVGFAQYLFGNYLAAATAYLAESADSDQVNRSESSQPNIKGPESSQIPDLLRAGMVSLDRHRDDAALGFFLAVLQQQPDHIDGLLLAGVTQTRLHRYDDAIHSLDRALNLFTSNQPRTFFYMLHAVGELHTLEERSQPYCLLALYHRYLRIYDSNHAGPALAYAQRAVDNADHSDIAHLTIGIVHYREHELNEALPAFLKAIDANPKNGFAYRWASILYSHRGDLVHEYEMLKRGYEVTPKDQHFPFHVFISEKIGDYQQALSLAIERLEAEPNDWRAQYFAARMYHRTGHDPESRTHYELALRQNPRDAGFYENYGSDLHHMNRNEEAIAAFRAAISLNPSSGTSHHGFGVVLDQLGRYKEAATEYETALRFGALDLEAHLNLCMVYFMRLLDFQRAAPCFRQVLQQSPRNPVALSYLSRSLDNL
ncbi:MAG: tetratricopeptide repeat protein [Nitrospiraceae bacterium]